MRIIEASPIPFLSFIVLVCLIKRGCFREIGFSQRPPAGGPLPAGEGLKTIYQALNIVIE